MGKQHGYKKYMKKEAQRDNSLLKIFVISFFGMLLVFTFLIKSFSPSVDTTVGDYSHDTEPRAEAAAEETKKIVDDRLVMIQSEDQGRNFSDLMAKPDDVKVVQPAPEPKPESENVIQDAPSETPAVEPEPQAEPVYKVFIGTYASAEQAKVAKEIIQETGSGLNPIVKCLGSNNYTLQVGIFKNKQSAASLLYTVQQNHLPGRIVQDY